MRAFKPSIPDAEERKRLALLAHNVLQRVRQGGRPTVCAPDEVAVARALRNLGATDLEMRRIRFRTDCVRVRCRMSLARTTFWDRTAR